VLLVREKVRDELISVFADAFILSCSENDLNEVYQILMENLIHITSAIQQIELNLKTSSSPSIHRTGDIVDIITTL
jgi:hypothetical protein